MTMQIGFAARLAAFYAAIFVVVGIQLPFFPLWLTAKGLDAQMIGVVLAAPMIVRIVAVPLSARVADRRDALRAVLVALSAATAVGYVMVGFSDGATIILLTFALASAAFSPVMPLAEAYALKGLAAHKRAYGPVRLWGSAAFIAGTFAAGIATDLIAARHLIWLIVAATALNAAAALALQPLSVAATPETASVGARMRLWRDPVFLAGAAAASLIQGSHAVYYGFSALQWSGAGFDGASIAALWSLGVAAEIGLFAISGRLPPMFRPSVLLIAGAGGACLRWAVMAYDPPAIWLPFLQLLHALSFGATHLGALALVARRAGEGQGATAQGHLSIALGLTMAAAMGLSGVLYARYGVLSYAAMGLAAAAGGACGLVANRAGRDTAA